MVGSIEIARSSFARPLSPAEIERDAADHRRQGKQDDQEVVPQRKRQDDNNAALQNPNVTHYPFAFCPRQLVPHPPPLLEYDIWLLLLIRYYHILTYPGRLDTLTLHPIPSRGALRASIIFRPPFEAQPFSGGSGQASESAKESETASPLLPAGSMKRRESSTSKRLMAWGLDHLVNHFSVFTWRYKCLSGSYLWQGKEVVDVDIQAGDQFVK